MPRRIVLHAGFHKTGTSTTQAVLRANRVALKRHVALRLRWQMKDLIHATRGYSTWRDPLSLIKAQHRFEMLLDALPGMPRRTLVISAEELGGHLPGRGDLADYSAMPVLLHAFWQILNERFPQAEILLYLSIRAPEPWLASAYWEHVKASGMTLDFDAFHARYHVAADLSGMVDRVASRLPCRVHATALEDCRDLPLGPADPLLDHCDVPMDVRVRLAPVAPANGRMDEDVLQALLEVNRTHAGAEARNAVKKAILAEARCA